MLTQCSCYQPVRLSQEQFDPATDVMIRNNCDPEVGPMRLLFMWTASDGTQVSLPGQVWLRKGETYIFPDGNLPNLKLAIAVYPDPFPKDVIDLRAGDVIDCVRARPGEYGPYDFVKGALGTIPVYPGRL